MLYTYNLCNGKWGFPGGSDGKESAKLYINHTSLKMEKKKVTR